MTAARKRVQGATLGARLREARDNAGLTQSQAAKRIGVDKGTLWRWEKDQTDAPMSKTLELAALYRVPPHELFNWTPRQFTEDDMPAALADFLAGHEARDLSESERLALLTMPLPPEVEPTYSMYHYFLLSIRAGVPAADAADGAQMTAEAKARGDALGWKELEDGEDDDRE